MADQSEGLPLSETSAVAEIEYAHDFYIFRC